MGNCCNTEGEAMIRQVTIKHQGDRDVDVALKLFNKGARGGAAMNTFMKLNLRLACRDLPNTDLLSKTDAFAVVFEQVNGEWVEKGRTETVANNLDPEFIQTIPIDYYFEQDQAFLVILSDSDELAKDYVSLKNSTYIGEGTFKIQSLVGSKDREIERPLTNKESEKAGELGFIQVSYEEAASTNNQELSLVLSPFSGGFEDGKMYFLNIMKEKMEHSNTWAPVVRTEKLYYNEALAPWKEIQIPLEQLLCSSRSNITESDIKVRVDLNKFDSSGDHRYLGALTLTIGELMSGDSLLKINSPDGTTYNLKLSMIKINRTPSFLDYINNGCEMSCVFGVDFTGSNSNPHTGFNLHDRDFTKNQYYNAILQVSNILLNFDSDQQVPLFGFGAMINEMYCNQVSHCFAMNGNFFRPECQGIEGIEACYRSTMGKVLFAGPTFFAPMLKLWNDMVRFEAERNPKKYYTFIILTDGANHDMTETVQEVVASSTLPISIIMIGIGDADFSNMNVLDADTQPLFCQRTQSFSKRDNVQFVEFNRYKHDLQLLARETLKELPRQMIEYFMTIRQMTPEDLEVSYDNQEVRDFFSYQAMQYMTNDHFTSLGVTPTVQKIVAEGIADPQCIDINKCIYGYTNNLKI